MFRFVTLIIVNVIPALICIHWMRDALKHHRDSIEECWIAARKVVALIIKRAHIAVEAEGLENLPEDGGYLLMPNHQGRFDGLAVTQTHEKPLSFVIDKARADISVETYFMDMNRAIRLPKEDPRASFHCMMEMAKRVMAGERICIFPEGGHNNNANQLQYFHTGCFHFMEKMNCPIVPCVLFDSYRVFNYQKFSECFKHVKVRVFYLPPIMPEEYKGLSKREMADLVRDRIQTKMNELLGEKNNKCC